MLIDHHKILLFIEPKNIGSAEPLLDALTYKLLNAMRTSVKRGIVTSDGEFHEGMSTRGVHYCTGCSNKDIHSAANDCLLECGLATNYLAVHYMAFHRDEVPFSEIEKIALLRSTENVDPPSKHELGDYAREKPKKTDDDDGAWMTDMRTGERIYI
jgi:hypothetical protein